VPTSQPLLQMRIAKLPVLSIARSNTSSTSLLASLFNPGNTCLLHFAHKLEQKREPQKTSSLSRGFVEEQQQQRILGEGGGGGGGTTNPLQRSTHRDPTKY